MPTTLRPRATLLALAAAAALAACAQPGAPSAAAAPAGDGTTTDTVLMLIPADGASPLQSGCWATFFDGKNFQGDSTTLVGPIELQSLDKGSAKQLRRDIDSIVTGPKTMLVLYQKQLFSARSVGFEPGSREPSLIEKLGFGGRIESIRLQCRS